MMEIWKALMITLLLIIAFAFGSIINYVHAVNYSAHHNFNELFESIWAPHHIVTNGDQTSLSLNSSSGCGFESKKKYLFGKISAQLKLVQGDSAGTVTTFYMASEGPNRDELDFEFLGNVPGEKYIVQTNLYVNGNGNREQRHYLWFDPTADFHNYSFLWNRLSILFLVDDLPIREFTNKEEKGIPYPENQALLIHGSIWNGDDWATQGGRVKINWSHTPFVATFKSSWEIDACEISRDEKEDPVVKCDQQAGHFWWDKPVGKEVYEKWERQLKWVRRHFLVYDYCQDFARFAAKGMPKECQG